MNDNDDHEGGVERETGRDDDDDHEGGVERERES